MSRLSALGSGLLLGAGLGIIIPECVSSINLGGTHLKPVCSRGIEAIIEASDSGDSPTHTHFPGTTIAVSLLVGFMFMLVTEQLLPGAHSYPGLLSPKDSTVEFDADVELGELEEEPTRSAHPTTPRSASTSAQHLTTPRGDGLSFPVSGKGFALTLGLVFHAFSDGLALGTSIISDAGSQDLSLVIFAALVIHKGTIALHICTEIGFLI